MSDNSTKALRSGVWYTIGNFITKGLAFLTMPIFTRIMSKNDIGDYANLTSWAALLGTLVTLDLHTAVTVAKFEFKEKHDDFISSNLFLGSVITCLFYVIVLVFKSFFLDLFGFSFFELNVVFIYLLVSPALQMFQIKNRLEYKYKLSVALSLGSSFVTTLTSLLLVILFHNKLYGRIIGYYVPLIVLNIIIYFYFIFRSRKIVDLEYWKYGLNIALPLVLHVLAGNLLTSSDRIMIKNICGSEDTAYYSVAYSCAFIVSILWTSMNTAWSPWAFEQMDEKNYAALKKASKPYIIFFGVIVFCFLLIAPEVLLLMGGKSYLSALVVVPPVMVAYVFQFVYSLYVNIETFCKKQKYIAIGTTIAAVINVGLNYLLIPVFGYAAAAYTTLVGYVVLFMIHYIFIKSLGKADWYDTKFNFTFLGVFLVIMIAINILYRFNVIRYALIALLFILGVFLLVYLRKELLFLVRHKSLSELKNKINSIGNR